MNQALAGSGKKRGRPASKKAEKADEGAAANKQACRTKKGQKVDVLDAAAVEEEEEEEGAAPQAKPPAKRGRPAKVGRGDGG